MTSLNTTMVEVWTRYSIPEFFRVFCPIAFAVDRIMTPIWYVIGICGNIMAAKIWTEKRMRSNNSSAIYLSTLSVTDLVFLVLHIMQELQYAWDVHTLYYPGICETYFMLVMTAQYLSPILVLGFTVERYIAVCHPFKKEEYCSTTRALRVVIGLITLSLLLCIMQAYLWTYNQNDKKCEVRQAAMNSHLWIVWTWTTEMLIFLVVPLVILIFNILVIKEVRKMSRTGQMSLPGQAKNTKGSSRATTVMLLSVSFYVIFTTLPATVVYAMVSQFPEGQPNLTDLQIFADPEWSRYRGYMTGRKFVEEICLSHYACNFILYFITGEHFRKCFLETIRCKTHKAFSFKSNGNYSEISQAPKPFHQTQTTHVSHF